MIANGAPLQFAIEPLTNPDRSTIWGYIPKIAELKCGVAAARCGLTAAERRATKAMFVVI